MTPAEQIADISDQITARYGVEGVDLLQKKRRLGRRWPRALRRDLQVLVQAQKMLVHPKLALHVSPSEVNRAYGRICEGIAHVSLNDRRKAAVLGALGGLGFNVLLAIVACLVLAVYMGLV